MRSGAGGENRLLRACLTDARSGQSMPSRFQDAACNGAARVAAQVIAPVLQHEKEGGTWSLVSLPLGPDATGARPTAETPTSLVSPRQGLYTETRSVIAAPNGYASCTISQASADHPKERRAWLAPFIISVCTGELGTEKTDSKPCHGFCCRRHREKDHLIEQFEGRRSRGPAGGQEDGDRSRSRRRPPDWR